MYAIDGLPLDVLASQAAHALTHLSSLSRETAEDARLARALDAIGDREGETWLHLYGLCLEGERDLDSLIHEVERLTPTEFREVVLGATAWSWVNILGKELLEHVVAGDEEAIQEALANARYYAGNAATSLSEIVGLSAEATKSRFLEALHEYRRAHGADLDLVAPELAAREKAAMAAVEIDTEAAVVDITGYRYIAEPEASRVALVLHGYDTSLCLAQHDGVRLIVSGVRIRPDTVSTMVELGMAISDENRLRLLEKIAKGPSSLGPLVESTGLSRSTVHHHLAVLREAGLVEVEGNARSYLYRLAPDATGRWTTAWQRLTTGNREETE